MQSKTGLYYVNWQREVSVHEQDGKKVVVKRNKPTKEFHEFLLVYMYSLISLVLVRPSAPLISSEFMKNEGNEMRKNLANIGISTPNLISISEMDLVEEFVEGGDLYLAFVSGQSTRLGFVVGQITGKMHNAGYAFVDNKAQNYLVKHDSIVRTDLSLIQKKNSLYTRSMDIGSFLASVMDLARYGEIEKEFYNGYLSESGRKFSYTSIIIRNVLSLGFSSDSKTTLRNMLLDASHLVES